MTKPQTREFQEKNILIPAIMPVAGSGTIRRSVNRKRGRSLVVWPACPGGETGWLAKMGDSDDSTPRALAEWVKELRRLYAVSWQFCETPSPSGQAGWGRVMCVSLLG